MWEHWGTRRGQRLRPILYAIAFGLLFSPEARSQAPAGLAAVRVASGLSQPIFATAPSGDYNRLFIVRQTGQVHILNLATGNVNAAAFLDIQAFLTATNGEQGLLGMAFDPNYSTSGNPGQGKFYLYFTVPGGAFGSGVTHVSQFKVSSRNPDLADPTSLATIGTVNEKLLLSFDHPQSNHNGGWIGFSPRTGDAYNLYIASGDGGNGDDQGTGHHEPGGNAQWNETMLGKVLRIHIDPASGTASIPADNPFAASSPPIVKEIWLLGLRNPFRNSFDRLTGRMFIGDVGQSTREEVDVQLPDNPGGGENYGWRDREGLIQNPSYATATPTPTPFPPRVDPIIDYPRSIGGTVIGGYVYRGKQIPQLQGVYVLGDYLQSRIFTLNYDGTSASNFQDITASIFPTSVGGFSLANPSGFGEDANGELYITDISNGSIFKIVPVTPNVQINSITKSSSNAHVTGLGVPFTTVTVKATSDLLQPFTSLTTASVAGDGTFHFDDNVTGSSMRFYRVNYP